AMPIVRAVGDGLAGDRITRIVAILNGTTNAVLSRMDATGCSLDDALADARAKGFAEADPSADLSGDDARAKLAILCALAFGVRVKPEDVGGRSSAGVTCREIANARLRGGAICQPAPARNRTRRAGAAAVGGPRVRGARFDLRAHDRRAECRADHR